ncbi:hypothetical protein ACU686_24150 [Yinghuangia aomiensis]
MKAGAFQLGQISDPGIAQQAGSGGGFDLVRQPTLAYHTLMLNGRRGPLQNQQVRQAIACAVDRDQGPQDGGATWRRHGHRAHHQPGVPIPGRPRRPCLQARRHRPGQADARRGRLAATDSPSTPSWRPANTPPRAPRRRTSRPSSPRSA